LTKYGKYSGRAARWCLTNSTVITFDQQRKSY